MKNNRGFSIIELMVALVLSSILLLGLSEVFSANQQSYTQQNAFARVQESGRISMELLSRSIRMADYWGCFNGGLPNINNLLDDDDSFSYDIDNFSESLAGADDVSSVSISSKAVTDGTDTLTIRGASTNNGVTVGTPYMNTNSAALHVSTGNGFAQEDILLLSDCESAELFQVTSANPDTSGQVTHNTGTGTPGNYSQNFSKTYAGDAFILSPYTKVFFVAAGAFSGTSLWQNLNGVNTELVSGVTNIQLQYGEDDNEDGTVDNFYDADNAALDMEKVLSIQITLSMDSGENLQVGGAAFTRSINSTVAIRNRL